MIEFIKWFIPAIMHNKTMFSSLSVKNIAWNESVKFIELILLFIALYLDA
jgi:hypothetical protein